MAFLMLKDVQGNAHRGVQLADGTMLKEGRRASPRYQTIDPEQLRPTFDSAGFETRLVSFSATRRALALTGPDKDGYSQSMKILFDHSGTRAVCFEPGVMRWECENEFVAPFHKLRHDSGDVPHFLSDPVEYVRQILSRHKGLADKIESLRNVGDGWDLISLVKPWKVIHKKARRFMFGEYQEGDFWSALQALTRTHYRTAEQLASACLTDRVYPMVKIGALPPIWTALEALSRSAVCHRHSARACSN